MAISDWAPGIGDVGDVLRARTKDTNGVELGIFNADTRPTGDQVTGLIATASGDLAAVIGSDIPEPTWPLAQSVGAIGAAMLIELSYFPEQVATGRSPYDQLRELYEARMSRLKDAVVDAGGTVTDDASIVARSPVYHFDPSPIIGKRTPW